ncbi:MAG: GatB/YqeY domain-containing protein [Anaerolineae bacterium]
MNLKDRLMQDLKEAMKTGDEARKGTIRLLRAAINAAEIEKRATFVDSQQAGGVDVETLALDNAQFALTDAEVQAVLQKQAKQRRDSIAEYQKAGRDDLVAAEQAELAIIETYLPRQMTRDEIEQAARKAAAELGISNMSGMGPLMKHLMAEFQGKADGRLVNEVVREVLSSG